MLRYTAVLFDLDGTLLNTLEDLTTSLNTALEAQGFPCHSQAAVCRFVGDGIGQLVRRALPPSAGEDAYAAVLQAFRLHYAQHHADATRPYEGVPAMLQALGRMGVRLAIVSNKNDENVKALSDRYFGISVAIGQQEGLRPKPAPDSMLAAMEALDADPAHTLYVGDSDVDIQTAQNVCVPCLSVTWGFRSHKELAAAGATHFAHKPEDVVAFVAGAEGQG